MALITMTHTIGTVAILIRRRGKVGIPAVVGKIPGWGGSRWTSHWSRRPMVEARRTP